MQFGAAVTNFILLVASIAAMYLLDPGTNPWEYSVAAFGAVHGLLGLIRTLGNDDDECNRVQMISTSIMDVIPIAAANIELYSGSGQAVLQPIHFLSAIPLFYDLMDKMSDEEDGSTETLKDLTILGNIASNVYLGYAEGKPLFTAVGGVAFVARYGAALLDKFIEGIGAHIQILGYAAIIGVSAYVITNK